MRAHRPARLVARPLVLLLTLVLAHLLAVPPAVARGARDGDGVQLTWKGRSWTFAEAAPELPDATREELLAWESWCRDVDYQAVLDDDARVLLVVSAKRGNVEDLIERAHKAIELFEQIVPQPERDPEETFLVPDWGRGQHVPDRDPIAVAVLEREPDFESLLSVLAANEPALNGRVLRKQGAPAFYSGEALAGALLSAPDGFELGTVWRAENELVNRLARLLLHRRFGDLPYWLDMGLAWHVEMEVQGDLYSFPGRDDFVSTADHGGWRNELKREFKKRRKQPLRLEEFADWQPGTWDAHKVALAWGFTRFLATHPERPLAAIAEDLRLDVKQGSVRYAEDGSWSLVTGYHPSLETQHEILARHLGDDYLEQASQVFKAGKR